MDLHALTDEVRALEGRRDELEKDIATLEVELRDAEARRDERVKHTAQVRKKRRAIIIAAITIVVVTTTIVAVIWLEDIEEVTLLGTVTEATETAPVSADSTCRIHIEQDYGPFNAHVKIDCAGARLYGNDTGFGAIRCETEDSVIVRCEDPEDIRYDGDPRLLIDRRAGEVRLDDGRRWSVVIALDED